MKWLKEWRPAWSPASREILETFVFSRFALILVGLVALGRLSWVYYSPTYNVTSNPFLLMWLRWDSLWYLAIAQHGYWAQALAFFPLYPLTVAALHWVSGIAYGTAAVLISNGLFLGFLFVFYTLVKEQLSNPKVARRAVWMAVAFPTAFFNSAGYTESMFLFTTVMTFWMASRRNLWWAGVFGMLAALTRNEGAFTVIPILYAAWRAYGLHWNPRILAVGLVPAGIGLFMLFQWRVFGSPLAFIHVQSFWGRHITWPWTGIYLAIKGIFGGKTLQLGSVLSMIDLVAALSAMVLWVYAWRQRLPWDWLVYWGVLLLIDISAPVMQGTSPLLSMSRLVEILFPVYAALGILSENLSWRRFLHWSMPLLQAVFFVLYSTWHWIA